MERDFFPQRAFALFSIKKVGVYSDEVTPVPIPNTEVKLINVDDTWLATTRESKTMPAQYSSLAQSVEHSAVNRVVARSSRAGGAKKPESLRFSGLIFCIKKLLFMQEHFFSSDVSQRRIRRQADNMGKSN